jgi:hypothetical protein
MQIIVNSTRILETTKYNEIWIAISFKEFKKNVLLTFLILSAIFNKIKQIIKELKCIKKFKKKLMFFNFNRDKDMILTYKVSQN